MMRIERRGLCAPRRPVGRRAALRGNRQSVLQILSGARGRRYCRICDPAECRKRESMPAAPPYRRAGCRARHRIAPAALSPEICFDDLGAHRVELFVKQRRAIRHRRTFVEEGIVDIHRAPWRLSIHAPDVPTQTGVEAPGVADRLRFSTSSTPPSRGAGNHALRARRILAVRRCRAGPWRRPRAARQTLSVCAP